MESGVKKHASDGSSDRGLPPMEARTETKIDNFFDKRKSMSTITLENVRACSDITMKVRLKDNGVAVDWSGLTDIKALVYSDVQKAVAGRCAVSVDSEDHTVLVCLYAATKPQYLGVNSIVVRAKYMGREKTYDKQAVNIVARTAELEGEQVVLEDPEVTVDIEVVEVDSSILDAAIAAALAGADRAEAAAQKASDAASHAPCIINGFWFVYDSESGEYVTTGVKATGEDGVSPHIGSNGNWFVGSVDTGVAAQGPQGLSGNLNWPTFHIDAAMHLQMTTDVSSNADHFSIDDEGHLILTI